MKNILITGKDSYIGESFKEYVSEDDYSIDTVNTIDDEWKSVDFSKYDVVFHVAGIVHKKDSDENDELYYKVNRDLAYDVAKEAKQCGVAQFIFMSTMSVYGVNVGIIGRDKVPNPLTVYGKSKLEAEELINELSDDNFRVVILRPPVIYGKNCKGNYVALSSFVKKFPIFPDFESKRSMIHIDNFSSFVKKIVDNNCKGIFCPQNDQYVCTSHMVKLIAKFNGKKIIMTRIFNPFIKLAMKMNISIFRKVFGTLIYDDSLSLEFDRIGFEETIRKTEE